MQWRLHQHSARAQGGNVRVYLGLELQTQHPPAQAVEASRLCSRQEPRPPRQGGEGEGTIDNQGGCHLPYHERDFSHHRGWYWNLDQTQHYCQDRALTCSRLAF